MKLTEEKENDCSPPIGSSMQPRKDRDGRWFPASNTECFQTVIGCACFLRNSRGGGREAEIKTSFMHVGQMIRKIIPY